MAEIDMKEKLVELANDVLRYLPWGEIQKDTAERIADRMMDHGVTVQEWISVKDERKPNHGDIALCYMTFEEYRLLQWDDRSKVWVGDYMDYKFESVAYWQRPQPPKGE